MWLERYCGRLYQMKAPYSIRDLIKALYKVNNKLGLCVRACVRACPHQVVLRNFNMFHV